MLQLKHLLHDRERALQILSRWNYDEGQSGLMEQFRISANAVYPYEHNGVRHFLRFAHEEEKSKEHILAELEFLQYLRSKGYPCLQPVASKQGNELEEVQTENGLYYAVSFRGVPGKSLGDQPLTADLLYGWGKHMGWLHRLSQGFTPEKHRRKDHVDQLTWMGEVLATFPNEDLARQELEVVGNWLAGLPKDAQNYGLIHYDFELDNVFYYASTMQVYVIDFDDAVYHWYAMDIANALASYEGEEYSLAKEQFVAGYRTEHSLADEWLSLSHGFDRYHKLFNYVRVIRSTKDEDFGDEPEWMAGLRKKLARFCEVRSADFGKPI